MDNYQNENNHNNGDYTAHETQVYNQQNNYMPQQSDKVSVGFCILGWFIPIFALIYFLTKRQEKPKGAKAVGICGLVSFILNIIVVIISFALTGSIFNKTFDYIQNVDDSSIIEEYYNDESEDFVLDYDNTKNDSADRKTLKSNKSKQNIGLQFDENTTISLPITYSDFNNKTGYVINDEDKEKIINPTETTVIPFSNGNYSLNVIFTNTFSEAKLITDCYITEISLDAYWSNPNIKFNDLHLEQQTNKQELTELFGEPSYEYDDGNFQSYEFLQDNEMLLVVNLYNGEISELELSCSDE